MLYSFTYTMNCTLLWYISTWACIYIYFIYDLYTFTCMCAFVNMSKYFLVKLDTYFSEFGFFDLLSLNLTCDNNINIFSVSAYIYWCIFNSAAPEFIPGRHNALALCWSTVSDPGPPLDRRGPMYCNCWVPICHKDIYIYNNIIYWSQGGPRVSGFCKP